MTKVLTLIDDEVLARWEGSWGKPVDGKFTENPRTTYQKIGNYYHVFWWIGDVLNKVAWQSNGNPCWVSPQEYHAYVCGCSMVEPDFSLEEIELAEKLMEGS